MHIKGAGKGVRRLGKGVLVLALALSAGQLVDMPVASADIRINDASSDSYIELKCSSPSTTYTVASPDKVTINGNKSWNGSSSPTISGGTWTVEVETNDDKTYQITGTAGEGNTLTVEDITPAPPSPPTPDPEPTPTITKDQQKSPVETRAVLVTLVNTGSDLLASQGFEQAANAVALEKAEAKENCNRDMVSGFTPFAAIGGSSLRVNSGSHVDIKGWGIDVGFAREVGNKQGKLLFGPVFEYGHGSYDSYVGAVHGSGGSSVWGFGLLARQQNFDGFYYEGSLRGGRTSSDYQSGAVSYDSSSGYWAGHLGVGKVVALKGDNTLDTYLKYFYTHQNGDNVTLGGLPLKFDAVDSHRLRLGTRLTHKINDKNSIYGGLAYHYEFGGDARATYNGTTTPSPSIKGGSGMLELGWQIKASDPVTLDFSLNGWVGKQRGITGQLGVNWKF